MGAGACGGRRRKREDRKINKELDVCSGCARSCISSILPGVCVWGLVLLVVAHGGPL